MASTSDLIKLLISLSSGLVGLSATFADKVADGTRYAILILFASWAALAASICFGVKVLSLLADAQYKDSDGWWGMVSPPMRNSWRGFLAGIALLLTYGVFAAWGHAMAEKPPQISNARTCTCACVHPATIVDGSAP
jgi:hypothetical protein